MASTSSPTRRSTGAPTKPTVTAHPAARQPPQEAPAASLSSLSSVPVGLRSTQAPHHGCDAGPQRAPWRRSAARAEASSAALAPAAAWRHLRREHSCRQLEFLNRREKASLEWKRLVVVVVQMINDTASLSWRVRKMHLIKKATD